MITVMAADALFSIPRVWRGFAAAIIGVMFWIGGLAILYLIYERYVDDQAGPPETQSELE